MIVAMKRVTLLCLEYRATETLDALRRIGVLHVVPVSAPAAPDLDRARRELENVRTVERRLADFLAAEGVESPASPASSQATPEASGAAVEQVAKELDRRQAALERLEGLGEEEAPFSALGDFDPALARDLTARHIPVRLCRLPRKAPLPSPARGSVVDLGEDKTYRYLALVGADDDVDVEGAEDIPLPSRPLRDIRRDVREAEKELSEATRELRAMVDALPVVMECVAQHEQDVAFQEVRFSMGEGGRVSYLQGFCPEDRIEELQLAARQHGWGIVSRVPDKDDQVPTLLRNPAWVRPIRALFSFLHILPGYREIDISGAFLVFYSIFFAMLVGDAGYGLLFLGLTAILRRFAPKIPRDVTRLLGMLGVSTIIWGALTGTWFSIPHLPAPLAGLRIEWLRNDNNLMGLCFLLGAVHLSLAHAWIALRVGKFFLSLVETAWIAAIWTMYFAARTLIMGQAFPGWVMWMFVPAVIIILLFMTPPKALRQEFHKHIMLPLTLISNFGDLVSYVRLFAVGSATAAISVAFNDMAVGDGIGGVGDALVATVILLAAHGLNILLCGLAVIVHGVRLNTLEFCGHMNIQWTGFSYRPFARGALKGHAGAQTDTQASTTSEQEGVVT